MLSSHARYHTFVRHFVAAATTRPLFEDLRRMRREAIPTVRVAEGSVVRLRPLELDERAA
jgi:glutaredoxin-related protein